MAYQKMEEKDNDFFWHLGEGMLDNMLLIFKRNEPLTLV